VIRHFAIGLGLALVRSRLRHRRLWRRAISAQSSKNSLTASGGRAPDGVHDLDSTDVVELSVFTFEAFFYVILIAGIRLSRCGGREGAPSRTAFLAAR
jgi:hypothetical protein